MTYALAQLGTGKRDSRATSHNLVIMANPQQPHIANLNAAINGMAADSNTIAQGVQSFINHQQALGTKLSLFGNTPLGQIHQQLATMQATMQASIRELIDLSAAR